MPHFLHKEQQKAFNHSSAKKVVIFNLSDKNIPDEFHDQPLEEHLKLVLKHARDFKFDVALIDSSQQGAGAEFNELVGKCGARVLAEDIRDDQYQFRHSRQKLISAISHILA
jgi:2-phospho-L-lactate transferase/gluconeogenesis factor (CofD/UPF0052 family)